MAKKKRKPTIHHVPDGKTLVKSHAYGDHLRDKRGTHTETTLNDSLAANQNLTPVINATAKLVNDLLLVYGGNFRQKDFWGKLLSPLRKAKSDDRAVLFASLKDLPLNGRYPLTHLYRVSLGKVMRIKQQLVVPIFCFNTPRFKDGSDCYYLETCVLFFGKGYKPGTFAVERTDWMPVDSKHNQLSFTFNLPARTKYYVVCVKIGGGIGGRASDTFASMGIDVVGSGVV